MTDKVAVRDAGLYELTVWHELGADGRPACRHGCNPATSYRVEDRADLPEDVTQCEYCSGEKRPASGFRPDSPADVLDQADAEEVFGE